LAVADVTFGLKNGESLGIVGESGCGKSTLALAITHLLPPNSNVTAGRIYFGGKVIVDTESGASFSLRKSRKGMENEKKLSSVRWSGISMIFQGALDSLNPLFKIGEQVDDIFVYKQGMEKKDARAKTLELLESVGLENWVAGVFPHQLSGGMKQRVIIAMAISLNPLLVIADEPTTSLDVITQYRIIEEIRKLQRQHDIALINISHDISLISNLSERIMVMYAGRAVEKFPASNFDVAQHPYTRLLVDSIPTIDKQLRYIKPIRGYPPSLEQTFQGCPFFERCDYGMEMCRTEEAVKPAEISRGHFVACPVLPFSVSKQGKTNSTQDKTLLEMENIEVGQSVETVIEARGLTRLYMKKTGIRESGKGKDATVTAVDNIDVILKSGESLAIVGETGSGKSTLSRILSMLEPGSTGEVLVMGNPVDATDRKSVSPFRKAVQVVFQDPYQSLNPRHSVFEIVSEPLSVNHVTGERKEMLALVQEALLKAGLTPPDDYLGKYPHQLSGGQRQRVSIARALVLHPKVLITDEPISMLDVSLRAGILNLLRKLKIEDHVSILYITHDIGSARYVSDRIAVMYRGKIVEEGRTEDIIAKPSHPYTMALLVSSVGIKGDLFQVLGEKIFEQAEKAPETGCGFAPRCPFSSERCFTEAPHFEKVEEGHRSLCHFTGELFVQMSGYHDSDGGGLEPQMKKMLSSQKANK
jgi:peptide/nickel transport system ATP-binding protein